MLNNICTYGLFRKDECNYNYCKKQFGSGSILYTKTIEIPGWIMYDCAFNPSIERTLSPDDKIVVDLIRVDEKVYDFIKKVDSGGTFFEDVISIDDVSYSIFIEATVKNKIRQIEKGDWKIATEGQYL